jgi:dTDP-glucose 4,6-dehydratase
MQLLVAGGGGFIGSHFIRVTLESEPETRVTNLDLLTYAAHPDTLASLAKLSPHRYEFLKADITSPDLVHQLEGKTFDAIVNFAAETHVDRSILDPSAFVRTNVLGIQNLLNFARSRNGLKLLHVSTDEVYGSLEPNDAPFVESSPLSPNSPYAASKASADLLVLASYRTYGQPVVLTRCSNNYGPFQYPEKLLPLVLANALEDQPIPVYGDGKQVRDWIHVEDHCRAIQCVLQEGRLGEIYNISAEDEWPNLKLIQKLLALLGKPESLMTYVGDRPAHDRRYALDSRKIRDELGWKPRFTIEEGLRQTVHWYLENQSWWKKVRDKAYFNYYQANYRPKFQSGEL